MSAVLRGRNLSLEQSLGVIADAMQREFPPHVCALPENVGPVFLQRDCNGSGVGCAMTWYDALQVGLVVIDG
jgi:hypothetical protein